MNSHRNMRTRPQAASSGSLAMSSITLERDPAAERSEAQVVAAEAHPVTERRLIPLTLTWEALAWITLLVLASITRFWDLGSRALHHDESLHAYYSWIFAEGNGYTHNPLMHGPFLFHIDALFFLLFGDSDAVSRAPAALAGVLLVGVPWLLRGPGFLGRWGALVSGVLLLVSPSILFYTRFIRHDPFTILGVLVLFVCIVRYIDRPERRWLILGSGTIAFLLANHEIVFANLALFFGYLYAVLVIDRLRAWWPERREAVLAVVGAHLLAVAGLLAVMVLTPSSARDVLLDIPWQNPTRQEQIDYYQALIQNPFIIGLAVVGIGFIAALIYGLRLARRTGYDDGEPGGQLLGDAPAGSVAAGVRSAWRDVVGLGMALLVGFAIFAALFTTLFTNLHGLATATFATDGTLLYWLGQHEVQRGNQPWFYYLVLMPQYEFIGFLVGFAASAVIAVRALGAAVGVWSPGRNLFVRGLLVTWFIGIFGGISYAGEKMPWLIIHAALPAALLAGLVIGAMIERGIAFGRRRELSRAEGVLFGGLVLLGASWIALAAVMTRPQYIRSADGGLTRTPTAWAVDNWWLLAIAPILALLAMGVFAFWRGPQRAALATAAALIVGLLIAQVHVGGRMTYFDGDVPRDMLIYTQTSPDIPMVISDLAELSDVLYGDLSIPVMYDSRSAWPLQWYLRDFSGRRYMSGGLATAPDVPALLISNEQFAQFAPYLDGYTSYDYVLRWWFPESMYRQFAIAPELRPGSSAWTSPTQPHGPIDVLQSMIDSIAGHDTPAAQQELYRLLMYRDLTEPNGQYGFKLLIRNDLLPIFNGIRY